MLINGATGRYLKPRNFPAIYIYTHTHTYIYIYDGDDDDSCDGGGGDGNNSRYTDESTDMNVDKLLYSSLTHDADPA